MAKWTKRVPRHRTADPNGQGHSMTIVLPSATNPPPQAAEEARREDLEKTQFG